MKIPEKTLYLVIIVLLISLGAVGWLYKGKATKVEEQENLIIALHDTLRITTNEKGQQVAEIQQIRTARVKDFTQIKNLTGENKRLQDAVKQNAGRLGTSGSVTTFASDTKVDVTVPTTVTFPEITPNSPINLVTNRDTVYLYPEYTAKVELGQWAKANVVSNKDSTRIKLGVYNEYTLVLGEEKQKGSGLFGKKLPFAEVTNLNPYSSTATLKTYSVDNKIKQKRLSLGVNTSYSPFNNQTYVGVGLNYALINIL